MRSTLNLLAPLLAYIVLLGSVVCHEFLHALTARKLGDRSPLLETRLTFNPLPHIDVLGTLILPLLMLMTRSPFLFGWAKPVPVNAYSFQNPKKGMMLVGVSELKLEWKGRNVSTTKRLTIMEIPQ